MKWSYMTMVKVAKNKKRLPRVGSTGVAYGRLTVRNAMSYEAYR